jgi:hypothetical protein
MRATIREAHASYAVAECPYVGDVLVHSLDLRAPSMIRNLTKGARIAFELDDYMVSGRRMRAKDLFVLIGANHVAR